MANNSSAGGINGELHNGSYKMGKMKLNLTNNAGFYYSSLNLTPQFELFWRRD